MSNMRLEGYKHCTAPRGEGYGGEGGEEEKGETHRHRQNTLRRTRLQQPSVRRPVLAEDLQAWDRHPGQECGAEATPWLPGGRGCPSLPPEQRAAVAASGGLGSAQGWPFRPAAGAAEVCR